MFCIFDRSWFKTSNLYEGWAPCLVQFVGKLAIWTVRKSSQVTLPLGVCRRNDCVHTDWYLRLSKAIKGAKEANNTSRCLFVRRTDINRRWTEINRGLVLGTLLMCCVSSSRHDLVSSKIWWDPDSVLVGHVRRARERHQAEPSAAEVRPCLLLLPSIRVWTPLINARCAQHRINMKFLRNFETKFDLDVWCTRGVGLGFLLLEDFK